MRRVAGLIAVVVLVLVGCSMDPVKSMKRDPAMQARVMGGIAADPELAGAMADQLLQNEASRMAAIDKLLANGDAMQLVMLSVAKDPNRLDGVIGLAVQDSSMRGHVVTLLKGIEMGQR